MLYDNRDLLAKKPNGHAADMAMNQTVGAPRVLLVKAVIYCRSRNACRASKGSGSLQLNFPADLRARQGDPTVLRDELRIGLPCILRCILPCILRCICTGRRRCCVCTWGGRIIDGLSLCMSVFLSVSLSISLFVVLSLQGCLSVSLSVCVGVCLLSVCLSVCPSLCLSLCLSLGLSVWRLALGGSGMAALTAVKSPRPSPSMMEC
jgi:hypothetical protein